LLAAGDSSLGLGGLDAGRLEGAPRRDKNTFLCTALPFLSLKHLPILFVPNCFADQSISPRVPVF
jgi:hypothetical protein